MFAGCDLAKMAVTKRDAEMSFLVGIERRIGASYPALFRVSPGKFEKKLAKPRLNTFLIGAVVPLFRYLLADLRPWKAWRKRLKNARCFTL